MLRVHFCFETFQTGRTLQCTAKTQSATSFASLRNCAGERHFSNLTRNTTNSLSLHSYARVFHCRSSFSCKHARRLDVLLFCRPLKRVHDGGTCTAITDERLAETQPAVNTPGCECPYPRPPISCMTERKNRWIMGRGEGVMNRSMVGKVSRGTAQRASLITM